MSRPEGQAGAELESSHGLAEVGKERLGDEAETLEAYDPGALVILGEMPERDAEVIVENIHDRGTDPVEMADSIRRGSEVLKLIHRRDRRHG